MEDAAPMLKVLLYLLPIALAIYALVDLVQTKDEDVQGLPKLAWVGLIVLVWVIGPIAWLLAGKRGRRPFLPHTSPRSGGGPAGRGRPLAPDDDPDFLRGLGRQTPPPSPPPVDPEDDAPDDPPITAR